MRCAALFVFETCLALQRGFRLRGGRLRFGVQVFGVAGVFFELLVQRQLALPDGHVACQVVSDALTQGMLVELSACVGGGGLEIVHALVYCGFFRFEGVQASETVCGGKRGVPADLGGVNACFLHGMALSIANDGFLQGVF